MRHFLRFGIPKIRSAQPRHAMNAATHASGRTRSMPLAILLRWVTESWRKSAWNSFFVCARGNFPPIDEASHQLPTKTRHPRGVFQRFSRVRSTESSEVMERAMGIEPTSEAWEASILPLYDARSLL
jgi:hypothetical protein